MTGDDRSVYRRSLSPKVILLAKSEIGIIHVRQALENRFCQRSGPRENHFASGIKSA
jgi:hypothetical protein